MTILDLVKDVCRELKLTVPSAVVSSTDNEIVTLLALATREGKELRSKFAWPKLTKEHAFSTSNGTDSYALPADIDYELFQTHWDRTNSWPLRGPLSPEHWQERVSGITSTHPQSGFRIKGFKTNQFYVEPTPGATYSFAFEYQTKTWILPVAWSASTAFTLNTYCSYNGNIYKATVAGTTSSTPPTHTSSTATDGTVTWTYISDPYERFTADTDVPQLDEELIILGVKWRWKRENGFEWQSYFQEYEDACRRAFTSQKSAPVIRIGSRDRRYLIDWHSIPDGGYGS